VTKLKRLCYGLLAITISVFLCLAMGEFALRWMGFRLPSWDRGDAVLGFATQANRTYRFTFPEHPFFFRSNNRAFLEDKDTPIEKALGTVRIVVLGDSQTEGLVINSESYPHRLGAILNGAATGRYEVINAGTGRYSPYQYYVKAVHQIVPLKPDHIIVGMYIGNDIQDLTRRDDRPYLTIEKDQVQSHPPVFIVFEDPTKPPTWLQSSRVYALVQKAFGSSLHYEITRASLLYHDASAQKRNLFAIAQYMLRVKQLNEISNGLMVTSLHQYNWFEWYPETLPTALRLNKEVMRMFRDLCNRHGIGLTYVLIPSKPRVEPQTLEPLFAKVRQYDKDFTIEKLQASEDQIARQTEKDGAELNVPVIDATQYLIDNRRGRQLYYQNDMHLTAAGNQLMAEAIAKRLALNSASSQAVANLRAQAGHP